MLIYLCDDSEIDTMRLEHYLNIYAEQMNMYFQLASFSSSQEMVTAFKQADNKPELIFLDIFMPELNGMEAARKLRNLQYNGGIIFTTSSKEHAMDSYEVNALYYLQKPYSRSHFENAMSRCGPLLKKAKPHFTFACRKKIVTLPYEDIIFFETGKSHTIILHSISGNFSFSGALTQIADFFSGTDCFLPVGRSFLINLDYVSKKSGSDIIMSDGSIVQVPLRKRGKILPIVESWIMKPPL